MLRRLKGALRDFAYSVTVFSDVKPIARRMFVTNSFDSILASIGVNIGGFSGEANPLLLAMSIIGGGVSLGLISNLLGVYMSERAERVRELRDLERKLASSLKGSIYWKAARFIPLYVALWSSIGVLLFPAMIAIPYLASSAGLVSLHNAFYASLAISITALAGVSAYLGKITHEGLLRGALRGLLLGLLSIVLVYSLKSVLVSAVG